MTRPQAKRSLRKSRRRHGQAAEDGDDEAETRCRLPPSPPRRNFSEGSGSPLRDGGLTRTEQARFRNRLNPVHPRYGFTRTYRRLWRLTKVLMWWLGLPGKWVWQLGRLVVFTMLLLPGLLPSFFIYVRSTTILKNVVYGKSMRHQLDIYLPLDSQGAPIASETVPVVIFISGGAWLIGYKAWGWIMGMIMQRQGVLFISADHRNFPQAAVGNMVQDVTRAVGWVLSNLEPFGGDPQNVILMGHSAGAHLSCLALLQQARLEAAGQLQQTPTPGMVYEAMSFNERASPSGPCGLTSDDELSDTSVFKNWRAGSLRAWCGVSGPWDIEKIMPYMQQRGLPATVIRALMSQDVQSHSPVHCVTALAGGGEQGTVALAALPEMHLFHGTDDLTSPVQQAKDFAESLQRAGKPAASTRLYAGKRHTDFILEDLCVGEQSDLILDLLEILKPGQDHSGVSGIPTLQPKPLVRLAKVINPF